MDGLRARAAGGVDDRSDVEIALPGGCGSDADCRVGLGDVAGVGVGIAEDGDGANTHLAKCANHAHCDLTAVGHQDCVEHPHILNTP
jgi:hypothetical protein